MKRIEVVIIVISLLYITIGNAQTSREIDPKEQILGVLGKNYTMEKYKNHSRNKAYLTFQVFVDSILKKNIYYIYINGEHFYREDIENI